jgi:hypothetical protein
VPRWLAVILRVAASLALFAGAAFWLLFAAVLNALRCDDGCSSPADSERWQYTGQLGIALVGAVLCLIGLVLGFTRYRRWSWPLVGASVLVALGWWTFVQEAGL